MSIDVALREQFRAALREELPAALAEALEAVKPALPKLATREECAQFLGVSTGTLDTLRKRGLPVVMVIESPRFDLADVRAWLASQQVEQ